MELPQPSSTVSALLESTQTHGSQPPSIGPFKTQVPSRLSRPVTAHCRKNRSTSTRRKIQPQAVHAARPARNPILVPFSPVPSLFTHKLAVSSWGLFFPKNNPATPNKAAPALNESRALQPVILIEAQPAERRN